MDSTAGVRLAELVPQDMIAVPLGPDQRFAVCRIARLFQAASKAAHACRYLRASLHPQPTAERRQSIVGSSSVTAKRWRLMVKVH